MPHTALEKSSSPAARLPEWLRQEIPDAGRMQAVRALLQEQGLHTVCEGARCPNAGQCWSAGVVTLLILGNACTRRCGFCAMAKEDPANVDPDEPERVGRFILKLDLRYVVITSVTRDDLPDGGAQHFRQTVLAIRQFKPETRIEALIPDFSGNSDSLETVRAGAPDVVSHNVEMPKRLFSRLRPQAVYERSLGVLRTLKRLDSRIVVKSGFMVGLGESDAEIRDLLGDLAASGCDIVTIGQYLAPSPRHARVERFVSPEIFRRYQAWGEAVGITCVVSGPLVRSSFLAESGFARFQQQRKREMIV